MMNSQKNLGVNSKSALKRSSACLLLTVSLLSTVSCVHKQHVDYETTQIDVSQDDPKIVPLDKGEKAPWDGVLLNDSAVAVVLVERERAEKICNARIEHDVALVKAERDAALEISRAETERERVACNVMTTSRDQRIAVLEERLIDETDDNTVAWVAASATVGFALGVAATVVTAVAVTNGE